MKVILVMVMSLDGKTTRWNKPGTNNWTSPEDQKYFSTFLENSNLVFMGRKTYEHAKQKMQHKKERLRVVITKSPEKFAKEKLPGQLEFTNATPDQLVKKFSSYKQALIVGGSEINTLFFQSNLVNEVWITIEPKIFGSGTPLVSNIPLDINLQLISIDNLNNNGTLLLKYRALH